MNGVYMPDEAQCWVCGRILPTYPKAAALLKDMGLLESQGMCVCPPDASPPARGFARVGGMMEFTGIRHKRE